MSDRLLAEAWRDLAGWHVGMLCSDEHVVLSVDTDDSTVLFSEIGFTAQDIPVLTLDSPANWGHWLAWLESNYEVLADDLRQENVRFNSELPGAILSFLCEFAEEHVLNEPLPPSVLAWWKSQQGEVSDGR